MSDPRPPDDGSSWPERDLDRHDEEPASGWSDDDPYRNEPPPRWEPQPFEPTPSETPARQPPRFDDPGEEEGFGTDVVEPAEVEEPTFGQPDSVEEGARDPWSPGRPEEPATEESPAEEPDADEQPAEEPAEPEEPAAGADPPIMEEQPAEAQVADEPAAEEPAADEPQAAAAPWTDAQDAEQVSPELPPEPEGEPAAQVEPEDEPEPVAMLPEEPAAPIAPVAAGEPLTPDTEAAEPVTAFDGPGDPWDPKLHGNRRRATTAEQAVPWLIGIILALAGMVIVLLALIFSSPNGLMAGQASATPTPSVEETALPSPSSGGAGGSPSTQPSATPEATPTSSEAPTYGALEMLYLGRQSAVAPVYLLNRDFSKKKQAEVVAQANQGIERYAWAPDGTVGAALISERAVALRDGKNPKLLVDNVSAMTFGWDAQTLYVVRINRDGGKDKAHVVQVSFPSGDTKLLATVTYPHPVTAPDAALREAQFIDDGGLVRLYAVADGHLTLWVLGAPDTYQIDPANGAVTKIAREPTLWSPDGSLRIGLHENNGRTTIRLRNRDDRTTATTTVTGLVSHVRWAGSNNEIVFTLGVVSAGGGVRQDLYVWDLTDGRDPLPLTSSGAAFGAEWRGVMPNWLP
jgi:hypothetical protein